MISNKKFSNLRIEYLHKNYFKHRLPNEINLKIEKIGMETDRVNMAKGISIPSELMYQNLFSELGLPIDKTLASKIYNDLEILFIENEPQSLYNLDELRSVFKKLKSNGFTINISSNTAYIKGSALNKVFIKNNLIDYFDFLIFSDEINTSKPSPAFFKELEKKCNTINVSKESILHIGDSIEADVNGAKNYGIKCKLIDYKKDNLIQFLEEHNF